MSCGAKLLFYNTPIFTLLGGINPCAFRRRTSDRTRASLQTSFLTFQPSSPTWTSTCVSVKFLSSSADTATPY
eukprot:2475354-Prorocentrum_lima.AAC.1